MKKIVLCAAALIMAATPAFAGSKACMKDTADNQAAVENYLVELIAKASPSALSSRPKLYGGNCKNEAARDECNQIMDRAEKLVQAGKADKIQPPKFKYDGSE